MADATPSTRLSDEEYVAEKLRRFEEYKSKIETEYWPNFKANKDILAGYDPQHPDRYKTGTARGILESSLNRIITARRKVSADVKGPVSAINRQIELSLNSIADSIFEDKDLAKRHGSYKANKKRLVRDLLGIGNCVGEKQYEYITTTTEDGTTRVLADGVYLSSTLTYDQYVFNPAYTWNTSPEKFLIKSTTFEALEADEYKEWTEDEEYQEQEEYQAPVLDETGQPGLNPDNSPLTAPASRMVTKTRKVKKSSGLYKNLNKVKEIASEKGKLKEWTGETGGYQPYTGTNELAARWVEDLEMLVCWEGANLCVIIEGSEIVWEEEDPFGTGTDNIVTAMLIEETGRPVAWGMVDCIRGLVQIKDDSLNQRKALLERALKIGGLYDEPDAGKRRIIEQVIRLGGVAPGDATKWKEINVVNPGVASAILSTAELNAEIQQTALYSPYAAGQLSQETDTTNGTASGIKSITQSAQPDLEVMLNAVEEQIDSPFLDFAMQAIANASTDSDIRWVMRTGGSRDAVAITKRFLQGRPTLEDLVMAGSVSQEDAQLFAQQNPQLATEPYIDADWSIRVSLDPMTESDKYQKAQGEKALVDEVINLGLPVNGQKAYTRIADKLGYEDFEEIFYSEEEIAQQQQAAKAAETEQLATQDKMAQTDHQRKLEILQASQSHDMALEGMKMSGHNPIAA